MTALRKWRQENYKLEGGIGNASRHCLKYEIKQNTPVKIIIDSEYLVPSGVYRNGLKKLADTNL